MHVHYSDATKHGKPLPREFFLPANVQFFRLKPQNVELFLTKQACEENIDFLHLGNCSEGKGINRGSLVRSHPAKVPLAKALVLFYVSLLFGHMDARHEFS